MIEINAYKDGFTYDDRIMYYAHKAACTLEQWLSLKGCVVSDSDRDMFHWLALFEMSKEGEDMESLKDEYMSFLGNVLGT